MSQMVMVVGGPHVLPAIPLIDAKRVAVVERITGKFLPHPLPFRMIDVDVVHFHGGIRLVCLVTFWFVKQFCQQNYLTL